MIFQLRSWFDFKPRFKPEIMKRNSDLLAGQFDIWHDSLPAGPGKKAHGVYLTSDSSEGIAALAKVRWSMANMMSWQSANLSGSVLSIVPRLFNGRSQSSTLLPLGSGNFQQFLSNPTSL